MTLLCAVITCVLIMTMHVLYATMHCIECEEMDSASRRLCHQQGPLAQSAYFNSVHAVPRGDLDWIEHVAKPYTRGRYIWVKNVVAAVVATTKNVVTAIVAQCAVVVAFVYAALNASWFVPIIAAVMQLLAFAFSWSTAALACFTGTNVAVIIVTLYGGHLFEHYSPQVLTAWIIAWTGVVGRVVLDPYVLVDILKESLQRIELNDVYLAGIVVMVLYLIGERLDSKGKPVRTIMLSGQILTLMVNTFVASVLHGFSEIFTWRHWAPVITIDVFPDTVGFFAYVVDGEVSYYRRFPPELGGRLIELEPAGGHGGIDSGYKDKWSIVKQYNIKHTTCAESAINGCGTYDKVIVNPGASPFPFGEYSVLNSTGLYSSAGCNIEGISVVTAHGIHNKKFVALKGGNMKRGGVKIDTDRYIFPHPDYTSKDVTIREAAFKRFVGTPLDFAVAKLTTDEWSAIGTKALQRKDFTQQDNVEATAVFGLGVEGELYKSEGHIPRQSAEVRNSGYVLHKVSTERGASGACVNVKVDGQVKKAAFHVARPEGNWIEFKNHYNLAISFSVIWSFLYEEGLVGDTVYDAIKGMLHKYQGHVDALPDALPDTDDECGEETPWANYHREWENSADIKRVREQVEDAEMWEDVRQGILERTTGDRYDEAPNTGKRAARSGDKPQCRPECRDEEILLNKLHNTKRDLEGKHMRMTKEGVMTVLGMTNSGVNRVLNSLIKQNLLDSKDDEDYHGVRAVTYGLREYAPVTAMLPGRNPNHRRKLQKAKCVQEIRLLREFSGEALVLPDGLVRYPCLEESKPAFLQITDGQYTVFGQTQTVVDGKPLEGPVGPPGAPDAAHGHVTIPLPCPGESMPTMCELAWTAAIAVAIPVVAVGAPQMFDPAIAPIVTCVANKTIAAVGTVAALHSLETRREASKKEAEVVITETVRDSLCDLDQDIAHLVKLRDAAKAAAHAAEAAVQRLLAPVIGESVDAPDAVIENKVSTTTEGIRTFFNGVPALTLSHAGPHRTDNSANAILAAGAEARDAEDASTPDAASENDDTEGELFDELNTEQDSQASTALPSCPLKHTIKEMQAMIVQGDTSFGPNLRERNVAEMHKTLITSDEFKLYRQYMTAVLPTHLDKEGTMPKQDAMPDKNGNPFFEHVATFLDSKGKSHSTIPDKKKKRAGVPTEETSKRVAAVDALLSEIGADVTKPWVTPVNDWTTIDQTMRAHGAMGVATAPTATQEEWQAALEFGVSVFDTSPLKTTLEEGVQGMHCVLQGLAEASSGVSQRFHNQNKRGWFTNAEYCRDLVDLVVCRLLLMQLHRDVIHTYDHEDLLHFGLKDVIVLTTKGERHKPEKAKAGRWRMIWVCSIVDCVVQKLLHKASNSRDIENYQSGKFQQSAAGMGHDPESMNHLCWSIEKLFGDDDMLVTCDASMFDMTMGEQAHLNHGRRRCLSVECDEVKGLIMSLAHINTRHICENKGYVWRCNKIGANASGQSSTTHDNGFTRVSQAGQAGALRVKANGDDMVCNNTIDIKALDKFGVMSRDVVVGDGKGGPSRIVPFTSHHIDRDTRKASYDKPEKLVWNLQDNIAGQEFPQRVDALIELLRDTPGALALFVKHMAPWHSAKGPNTTVVVPDKFAFKL